MIKLILLLLLFLFSLLVIFRAPTNLLWYLSIVATEFSGLFVLPLLLLLFWPSKTPVENIVSLLLGVSALFIFLFPYIQAWHISRQLKNNFGVAFPSSESFSKKEPFSPLRLINNFTTKKVSYQRFQYDSTHQLFLDFYPSQKKGIKPCIIVVHGGSWAAGDSRQLPDLNSELAKEGYHVASIIYRLAPDHLFPAPVADVQSAIHYLQDHSTELSLDKSRFVLLGRSAGGQIALSAAYTLQEKAIKAVINFYGPTDMVWGYENPTNPLVLDSRKIMEDYLGGTLEEVTQQYRQSSATETVTLKTPPTLSIYAENDPLVSPRHGDRLSEKLRQMSIPHFALYLPWATHAFDYTLHGPGGQLSTWTVKMFLQVVLEENK